MKRILFVVPRMNIGGAETYVFTVIKELHQRGYEVFLASGGGQLQINFPIWVYRLFFFLFVFPVLCLLGF